jgi:hypothetical protein
LARKALEDEQQHWLWVTRPEYYLGENGEEREDLAPGYDHPGSWWTCHKDTKRGDLALLYRTLPRCDLGVLIQATSDSFSITGDDYAAERGWDYACEWDVLYKFDDPLTLNDLRTDPRLDEWSALRGNFQRKAYRVPPDVWSRLFTRMAKQEPRFARFLERGGAKHRPRRILLEEQLEQRLVDNPGLLKPHGYHLEIVARQLVCQGPNGRIDLLGYDRRTKRHVVIELKNVQASRQVLGQIQSYLGWVEERYGKRPKPVGLVIARGFDSHFLYAVSTTPRIKHLTLQELGLR